MFEDDASVSAEIKMSKEALRNVEKEAEAIAEQESREWAKFASIVHKIDHALPDTRWNTIHYAEKSKYDDKEHDENVYATIVLETERFQVVYHLGNDEVLVLLKRDPVILGRLFRKILPRLPLLVAKISYDWERETSKLGAYISYVNYDYNSEYQELYQLLQRELAEMLKQKTYDTQANTEFKKLTSFS